MTTMTLSGSKFPVSPERASYNAVRLKYQVFAEKAAQQFSSEYSSNFKNIDDVHAKCTDIAMGLIQPVVEEAVRDLVAYKIFDIDEEEFGNYFSPYFTWHDDFEKIDDKYVAIVLKAEELDAYRTQRRENRGKWIGGGFGVGGAIQGALQAGAMNLAVGAVHGTFNLMAKGVSAVGDAMKKSALFSDPATKDILVNAVYRVIFNVHCALIDALNEKRPNTVTGYVSDDDAKKAERLLENIVKGRVPEQEVKALLMEAFTLNPYNEDLYAYCLQKSGDANGELEAIEAFFGVSVSRKAKKEAFAARLASLDLSTPESCKSSIVDLEWFAKSIGYQGFDNEKREIIARAERLDQERRTFNGVVHPSVDATERAKAQEQDKIARTVKGVVYATHEEAEKERVKKTIGTGFILGMVLLPFVMPFLTLRKGYSTNARIFSFGFLALGIAVGFLLPSKAPSHEPVATVPTMPAKSETTTPPVAEPQHTPVAVNSPSPATELPFIGRRLFNFMGGNGTELSIVVQQNGQARVESHGSTGSSVGYEGDFTNPLRFADGSGLLFKDNKVFLLKGDQIEKDCIEPGKECVSELLPD